MNYILPQSRRTPKALKVVLAAAALSIACSGFTIPAGAAFADSHQTPPSPSPSPIQDAVVPPPPAPAAESQAPPPPASAFPPLPDGSGSGRRVTYSNSQQRVWLVEADGTVAGSWLVSGRRSMPRPGVYRVFSKSRYSSARGGRVRMEFMTRFARGRRLAIGFHSIPVDRRGRLIQSEADLGKYRSSGCVRQKRSDAETMWHWAPIGTAVVVTR